MRLDNTPSVLLVEDDEDLRTTIAVFLHDEGFEIDMAQSVEQACSLLDRKTYNILLSDIGMVGCNGLDLVSMVQEANLPMIRVAMSGLPSNGQKAFQAGFEFFLTKPFNPEDLKELLLKVGTAH